jgi:threonine dehydratase
MREALDIALRGAERVVVVTDEEVEAAMRALFADTHNVAEGGGAAGLAALLQERGAMREKNVAVIVSGGNVDSDVYSRILSN